jgi:hypothetical protein
MGIKENNHMYTPKIASGRFTQISRHARSASALVDYTSAAFCGWKLHRDKASCIMQLADMEFIHEEMQ